MLVPSWHAINEICDVENGDLTRFGGANHC